MTIFTKIFVQMMTFAFDFLPKFVVGIYFCDDGCTLYSYSEQDERR